MNPNPLTWIAYTWMALGFIWLIGVAFTKRTVRRQPNGARLAHIALAALGFLLFNRQWLNDSWMNIRFAPFTPAVAWTGFALTLAGCLFAVWARLTLGANWSGIATVKADHELIRGGPYALARHPIYTGLLLAVAATGLAIGELRCIVGFVVIVLALLIKMSQEEKLMMETFPDQYPVYRQQVKALIPGLF